MAILRLNPSEFAQYHLQLAARFRPTIVRGVHAGAARVVQYLTEKTRVAPPANPAGKGVGGAVNTGQFLAGWRHEPLGDGAVVFNVAPYASIIEYGRRPGKFPPKEAIIQWIRRRFEMTYGEAEEIQYAIRKSIAERGLLARRIMTSQESVNRQLELVKAEVLYELERELKRRPK